MPTTRGTTTERRSSLLVAATVVVALGALGVSLVRMKRQAANTPAATSPLGAIPAATAHPGASLPDMSQLQSVAHRVVAAWRESGEAPTHLSGLPPDRESELAPPGSPATLDPPLDPWGREYILHRHQSGDRTVLSLITLGADGVPDGQDRNRDLWIEIDLDSYNAGDDGREPPSAHE